MQVAQVTATLLCEQLCLFKSVFCVGNMYFGMHSYEY